MHLLETFLEYALEYALPQLILFGLYVCVPHLEVLETSLSLGLDCFDHTSL